MFNSYRVLQAGRRVNQHLTTLTAAVNTSIKPVALAPLQTALCCRYKHNLLDYSRYPKLNEEELEETFTRGHGPGGQAVNKTSNCVLLRHLPTNTLVKCHTHRSAQQNRAEARKLLLEKLDVQINGELSIQAQLKAIEGKKSAERKRRQNKLHEMKQKWKEREEQDSEGPPKDAGKW